MWCPEPDSNRYAICAADFKSAVSTNFTIRALPHAIPARSLLRSLPRWYRTQPAHQEIHVICDNVSSHKTDAVQTFLAEHFNVSMHYTPTYLSWLNQVENWFAKIQRDVITRGVFTSTKDLDKKLMRYIRHYNKQAAPLKWKFAGPSRRIRCDSSGTVG